MIDVLVLLVIFVDVDGCSKRDGAAAGATDDDVVTCSIIAVGEWASSFEWNTYISF